MSGQAKVGTIVIGMRAGTGGLARDLGQARAEVGSFVSFSTSAFGALQAGLALVGVSKAIGFLREASKAAADLGEQSSAAGFRFGSGAAVVTAAAEEMAAKFGSNRTAFIESANQIGAIGEAAGKAGSENAEFSVGFVKMAADMESFFNVPFADAMGAIRSGLLGSSEPLQRFGVFLNEAKVAQEAVRLGLSKTGKDLDDSAKIQARASIITRGLAAANGNLAATMDSVANASRIAGGKVENFKVDVGTALADVSQFLTVGVNVALAKMLDLWGANGVSVKAWAEASVQQGGFVYEAIGKVGEAVGVLGDTWGWMKGYALAAFSGIVGGLQYLVDKLADFVGLIEDAVNGMGGLVGMGPVDLTSGIEAASAELFDLKEDAFAAAVEEFQKPALGDGARKFFDNLRHAAAAAVAEAKNVADEVDRAAGAQDALAKAGAKKGPSSAGAMERGSAEARSAILAFRRGADDANRQTADNTRQTAAGVRQVASNTDRLAGLLGSFLNQPAAL